MTLVIALLAASLTGSCGPAGEEERPRKILEGRADSELAPHGEGNVYAPEVLVEGGVYRMWYGGQGRDGHDRIHLAESRDGIAWDRKGVVLDNGETVRAKYVASSVNPKLLYTRLVPADALPATVRMALSGW